MLAVAVQLPAAALTDDDCGPTELDPAEASAGAASASNAQVTDSTDLMLTTKTLLSPGRTSRG